MREDLAKARDELTRVKEEVASARADVTAKEQELMRLRVLAEEKDQQAREFAVQSQSVLEEFERAKVRIAKDVRKDAEHSRRGMLLGFLEVLDDLDRAIAAAKESQDDSATLHGVELVRKGFLSKLAGFNVARMRCLGRAFDPEQHDALTMVQVSTNEQDGVIIGVVRDGYTIGDEILRPASVAVGKYAG